MAFTLQKAKLAKMVLHLFRQGGKHRLFRRVSSHNNNVIPGLKLWLQQPVGLPYAAADAVARHCVTKLFGHRNAQPVNVVALDPLAVDNAGAAGAGLASGIKGAKSVILAQRNSFFHIDIISLLNLRPPFSGLNHL